jgi:hypothetical protein
MEDFKSNPKMACFKEGGSVKYKSRKSVEKSDSVDIAQDKAVVKKAFAMHDKQEHEGEHTDLSKLKKGGRAKKDCGTVRKYKTGGNVTNVYEAKKDAGDKDNIRKVKDIVPAKLCGGKSVKKYSGEDGSYVTKAVDAVKSVGNDLKDKILGTPEQNRIAQEEMNKQAQAGSKLAKMLGGKTKDIPDVDNIPTRKKGGKVKKMNTGGTCS